MNTTRLAIALVFLTGCAVGGASARFVVPPASAQQAASLTKWEYLCVRTSAEAEEMTSEANRIGAQNWELTATAGAYDSPRLCFKRPKL